MKKTAARRGGRKAGARAAATLGVLQYRVVELSNVDEGALERTVNEQVRLGWAFDGVQFAMRESSKRPSMAFVFFTRTSAEPEQPYRPESDADRHLRRLVVGADAAEHAPAPVDAWTRLAQLAGEDE